MALGLSTPTLEGCLRIRTQGSFQTSWFPNPWEAGEQCQFGNVSPVYSRGGLYSNQNSRYHVCVEPKQTMPLPNYKELLEATKDFWTEIP